MPYTISNVKTKEEDDVHWDDISDDKLRDLLISSIKMKTILELENDFFERYLRRNSPEMLRKIDETISETSKSTQRSMFLPSTSPTRSVTDSIISSRDRGSPSMWSMQSGIRRGMLDPMMRRLRITIPQRMEMMKNEIIEFKKNLLLFEKSNRKEDIKFNAEVEELEVRIRDVKDTRVRFENDIVIGGIDHLTGKIPAETFIKFIKDWLKNINRSIEKVRLKSATIRLKIRKAKKQLIQREQLGEDLRPVDFERLKIQNEDCKKQINQSGQFLIDVKRVTENLMSLFNSITKEIHSNEHQAKDLQLKCLITEQEIKKAKKQLTSLTKLMNEYEVPEILDFVKLQNELRNLKRTFTHLERRKNIEQIKTNF
ncbi:coiled-coil domain-containing protein 113-like [Polistes fuscatus]|uniref:coiled-coil domain-containing protein 113-like n=1 Tax=Polistes fuscatus TaxID=30207 RepID=UPI001CA9BF7B|nr:coiled-coil domain-containing protein 113-like [Polistes fuscatus]